MLIGAHVSIAKSIDLCFDRAREIGANTIQIFTRSTSQWRIPPLKENGVEKFREKHGAFEIDPIVVHMPYLPNPSSPDPELHKRAINQISQEVERCHVLGAQYLVTHLGSHKGSGMVKGVQNVVKVLKAVCTKTKKIDDVQILLENTAGGTNSVGGDFETIGTIFNRLEKFDEKLGVCFDTCHAFAAGYDLRTKDAVKQTLDSFNDKIGIERLKVFHVNDSKGELGNHKDRHEHIGLGKIGLEGFKVLLNEKRIKNKAFILETPGNEIRSHKENIDLLKEISK